MEYTEPYLRALERELEHARGTTPGGRASNPDRVKMIEVEIRRARKALGRRETLETTDAARPAETMDGPSAATS